MHESRQGHGGARAGAGRPRRPPTLAAALRDAFPVERLVGIAEQMLSSESDDVKFRTLIQIIERCHGKVSDKLELSRGDDLEDDDAIAEQLTDEQLDQLEELDRRRAAVLVLPTPVGAKPVGVAAK